MRVERVFRLLGLLLGLIAGVEYASFIISEAGVHGYALRAVVLMLTALAGALFGFFGLPYVTTKPFYWLEDKLNVTPLPDLVAATVGLLVGLLLAALVGLFLAKLPWYLGFVISLIVALVFAYWGVTLGLNRRNEMMALVLGPTRAGAVAPGQPAVASVLLDTSVIIDGRIMDIAQTGFLRDHMLVPHFVLAELQYIADSSDTLRRNRGRRGLEVLNLLQKEPLVDIEFIDDDVPDVAEVDMKLIRLARTRNAAVMTNDYNLNRVGAARGRARLESQYPRQRAEAGRHPRRGDERPAHQGWQGAEPGRRLPRRRHHDRGREWPPVHEPDHRGGGDLGVTNRGRPNDLCHAGRRVHHRAAAEAVAQDPGRRLRSLTRLS